MSTLRRLLEAPSVGTVGCKVGSQQELGPGGGSAVGISMARALGTPV